MSLLENFKNGSVISKLRSKSKIKTTTTIGFTVAILAAAFSALPDVIPKPLLDSDIATGQTISPIALVFMFYIVNALIFTPLARNKSPLRKIGKSTLLLLLILGVVEAAGTLFYSIGLTETSAVNASILGNAETIFAILIGLTIFRERLHSKEILPFVFIIIGTVSIPIITDLSEHGFGLTDFMFGDMMILIAGFFYCLDTFIAKHISHSVSTRRIVQVMSIAGASMAFGLMLAFQVPLYIDLLQISLMSTVGVLGIGITTLFFVIALRLIGAIRTVMIYSANTVFGVIYSGIYLSEPITLLNITSLGLVMVGLFALRSRLVSEKNVKNKIYNKNQG